VSDGELLEAAREHLGEVGQLRADRKIVRDALGELIAALGGVREVDGGERLAAALVDAHVALEATKDGGDTSCG
jgi:hypothetical protein